MKISWYLLLLLLVISCNNDLDLNAEARDIPIVYGLLSISEENQYIRVERAFLAANQPAKEIAVIPDSLYYNNLDVRIIETNSGQSFQLIEVDGNEIGLPREEGAFATDPNTLYAISTEDLSLQAGQSYELEIRRGENIPVVRAMTTVIDTVIITQPTARLNFSDNGNFRVRWFPRASDEDALPSVYDITLRINFSEVSLQDPDAEPVQQSLDWLLGKNLIDELEVLKQGSEFYTFLANNLEVKPNIRRDFQGIDIIVDSGGEEILDYVRVGQANLGITASQEIPFYTNLSEGRGIFSSSNRKIKSKILLSAATQELIQSNPLTSELNFNF